MEALLQYISLMVVYTVTTFGLGVAVRCSPDVRLMFWGVVGFVVIGLAMSVTFFGTQINLETPVKTFLWFFMCLVPLGFISAPPMLRFFKIRTEHVLTRDDFDETYRKYAQKNAKRNKERHGGFRWYNTKDYHEWRQQSQTHSQQQTKDDFRSKSNRSKKQRGRSTPNVWGSEKNEMFSVMGLANQDANAKQIKSAYRKLARKYHPDILASQNLSEAKIEHAMKRMKEINVAYEWLENNGYA